MRPAAARRLVWIERGLLALGSLLAIWYLFVLIRADRVRRMPLPSPPVAAPRLPGDAGDAGGPSVPSGIATASLPRGTWIARLEAPTARLSATVLEGSDDGTLARAAGHIEETAFPGQGGNLGIAGHRDTTFRAVRNLHVGDPLVVTTADRVYRYRITSTAIVQPTDVWVLDPTSSPTLTLVTCYPFQYLGHAPKRYIVKADLVGQEARAPSATAS